MRLWAPPYARGGAATEGLLGGLAQLGDAGGVVPAAGEDPGRGVDDGLAPGLPLGAPSGLLARCVSGHPRRHYSGP